MAPPSLVELTIRIVARRPFLIPIPSDIQDLVEAYMQKFLPKTTGKLLVEERPNVLPFYYYTLDGNWLMRNSLPNCWHLNKISFIARLRLDISDRVDSVGLINYHSSIPLALYPRSCCLTTHNGKLLIAELNTNAYSSWINYCRPSPIDLKYVSLSLHLDFPPSFLWLSHQDHVEPWFIKNCPYL